ncbi:histone-like nucleoid-structuring protein, MvaT/MvaU family [Larsenimonas rhizosphaerae]|uniref:DNA binding protein n=1 Tax=Larsenimonas rhizosphaerae TaxID=2944682 RepID=A0AA41ZD87_9GAMM|nr:histone-like nucleoid-structuring protein, MvaT/MvaU family [Larsenimonas rhizosphaerae]MCM2130459.1 DNA binding protein [Larsenimonas rhizosphaerae]MCX2523164.1 DNA binding protein [Larsenimonas rhizosphaerae]
MSLLNQYMEKEQLLKKLQDELSSLEQDQRLKKELEFKSRLESLMDEYDKRSEHVIELLSPGGAGASAKSAPASTTQRKKRKLKVYKNPHTGEVVETRGGNQKTLKVWKEEFGPETVESWLQD